MIVAEEMQHAMDQEVRQFFSDRVAMCLRLTKGGFSGDHHIAEKLRMQMCKRAFAHGKGEDIGRTIDATIIGVQTVDCGIVDDQ